MGCFKPLKQAYSGQISNLVRGYINHITKLEFLPAFKAVFSISIRKTTVDGGFRGAGLVPFKPEAVISKLDVRLQSPPPSPLPPTIWVSKTPTNARELGSQSALVREDLRRQDKSPTSLVHSPDQLTGGAEMMCIRLCCCATKFPCLRRQMTPQQSVNSVKSWTYTTPDFISDAA